MPAVEPPPGRLAAFTLTVAVVGVLPEAGEILSHLPPSAVVMVVSQSNEPVPASATCMT